MYYPNSPNIIDVEASGFGGDSYPIEVGLALSDGRKFCTLVLPTKHWDHWDDSAEQLHKISRETLQAHGRPVYEVACLLNELLEGVTVYSDGWVVDRPWMTTLFFAAGVKMRFNVSPLELILSESQMSVWHATKNEILTHANIERHRASCDAWVIQETFKRTRECSPER